MQKINNSQSKKRKQLRRCYFYLKWFKWKYFRLKLIMRNIDMLKIVGFRFICNIFIKVNVNRLNNHIQENVNRIRMLKEIET